MSVYKQEFINVLKRIEKIIKKSNIEYHNIIFIQLYKYAEIQLCLKNQIAILYICSPPTDKWKYKKPFIQIVDFIDKELIYENSSYIYKAVYQNALILYNQFLHDQEDARLNEIEISNALGIPIADLYF